MEADKRLPLKWDKFRTKYEYTDQLIKESLECLAFKSYLVLEDCILPYTHGLNIAM